jgi:Serine/threonine protein phosphatase
MPGPVGATLKELYCEKASLQCTLLIFFIQVDKLNALNCELSAGTTVVVALVFSGRLYVANVGDSRALLCRTDSNGVLRVVQLSVDHDLRNEDELLRLSQLGLDVEKFKQGIMLLLRLLFYLFFAT